MLCSNCNKNTAVVFINKTENGKTSTEGLCYACAKQRGINPLDIIVKNAHVICFVIIFFQKVILSNDG